MSQPQTARPIRRTAALSTLFALAMGIGCASTVIDQKAQASAKIHYDIAIVRMNEGDMRGSLRALLTSVESDPYLYEAHHGLGLVYHSLGQLDESLEHYEEAVKIRPKASAAYNNMGTLLIDLGRYDEAIKAFKVALGDILYPTPSLAEGNMGWALHKKGDTKTGVRHLRNSVATNPKFCRGYVWLARIAVEGEQADKAVSNHKRFSKHCVADPKIAESIPEEYKREMTYYLALGYLGQGLRQAARDTLAECATDAGDGFAGKCAKTLASLQ